jgi:hypothetical protein
VRFVDQAFVQYYRNTCFQIFFEVEIMSKKFKVIPFRAPHIKLIFRFQVELISGPVSDEFVEQNLQPPARVIEILGSQSLQKFHCAIFDAFDREEEHCYQFQLHGVSPMDPSAVIYSDADCLMDSVGYDAAKTSIEKLSLVKKQSFFYWFDFGDDWWHEVVLLDIVASSDIAETDFPRITERLGDSPPQYADWDEEDEIIEIDVSPELLARTIEIENLLREYCQSSLDDEFYEVCVLLLEDSVLNEFPLLKSKVQSWAAGIVHAAGRINYLFDSDSELYRPASEIAGYFGVSLSTMFVKSRLIFEGLDTNVLDPRYCIERVLENHPLTQFAEMIELLADRLDIDDE